MTQPPFKVVCWISEFILGFGYSREEAELNAQHGPSRKLIVEGGDYRIELLVHKNAIHDENTIIKVVQANEKVVRIPDFRTIVVGVRHADYAEGLADLIVEALHNVGTDPLILQVIGVLAVLDPMSTSHSTSILDLTDATDEMIEAAGNGWKPAPTPDPTAADLRGMAMELVGPHHEIGDVVVLPAPSPDAKSPVAAHETPHEGVD